MWEYVLFRIVRIIRKDSSYVLKAVRYIAYVSDNKLHLVFRGRKNQISGLKKAYLMNIYFKNDLMYICIYILHMCIDRHVCFCGDTVSITSLLK